MSDEVFEAGRTSPEVAALSPSPTKLAGRMGTGQLVLTVLAYNAPLGIMSGIVPLVIAFGPGTGTPLLYLGLGALMLLFAVGFSSIARLVGRPGAFYSYITLGLGKPVGLGGGFMALLAYLSGLSYILVFLGVLTQSLVRTTFSGPTIPWWVGSLVGALIIGVLGYLRIDFSARAIAVLLVLEIGAVIAYDAIVVAKGGATGELSARAFDPSLLATGGVAVGIVFALTSFGGFETTAIYRDEVKNPRRTVPLATFLSVIILTAIYAVGSWVVLQAFGEDQAVGVLAVSPTTGFYDSVSAFAGRVGFDVVGVLLVTSSFASLTSMHNVASRYFFSLARDGVLPVRLGQAHPRYNSPYRTSLLVSAVTLVFLLAVAGARVDPQVVYTKMSALGGYALLAEIVLASVGIAAYLVRRRIEAQLSTAVVAVSVVASVLLAGVLALVTSYIRTLSGTVTMSLVTIGATVLALVAGAVTAGVLRSRRPAVYAQVGSGD